MVTGRAPFRAETDPMLVVQILSSPPADIRQYRPDTSEAFARVIERALTKKPADRFQNMTEFSAALVEVARTSLRNERPRAGSKAKLAGWIVLALVVAVALALTFRR
jgi:serine/threonine-protein kinase